MRKNQFITHILQVLDPYKYVLRSFRERCPSGRQPARPEELKAKAIGMGIEGPYTSWWHMFGWNVFGILLMGPAVATQRFFDTLNKIESKLNESR